MPRSPSLRELLAEAQAAGEFTLPLPGDGATPRRHDALKRWGVKDLSFARIAEAHTDALAILAAAGQTARLPGLYGVWAADGPAGRVNYSRSPHGDWLLEGTKQFCSGADFLASALITAHGEAGNLLFDVALDDAGIRPRPSAWASAAMADTSTLAVDFLEVRVPAKHVVGGPDWYQAAARHARLTLPGDPAALGNLAAHYNGPEGSSLTITERDGGKWIKAGSIEGPLATRKNADGSISLVSIAPGSIGFDGLIGTDAGGNRTLTVRDSQHAYVYTEVK